MRQWVAAALKAHCVGADVPRASAQTKALGCPRLLTSKPPSSQFIKLHAAAYCVPNASALLCALRRMEGAKVGLARAAVLVPLLSWAVQNAAGAHARTIRTSRLAVGAGDGERLAYSVLERRRRNRGRPASKQPVGS
eukprot:5231005-Pleurochrysis_carterae.AAC.2